MLAQQVQATVSTAGARTTKRVEQMLEEYGVSISFTLFAGHVFPYPSLARCLCSRFACMDEGIHIHWSKLSL